MSDYSKTLDQTGPVPESAADESSLRPRRYRRYGIVAAVLLLCAIGSIVYWQWSKSSGLAAAERACRLGEWHVARTHLDRYLAHYPADANAHLLMAEAIIKDGSEEPRVAARQAIDHLQQIVGSDATMGTARLQEARLSLLVMLQPARAEHLLGESLKFTPDSFESNFLMWKLLDLTGRHVNSRDYFWRAYECSPGSEQPERLREWFLAEFYPETANDSFHRAMGAVAIGKIPASVNLLVRFRESEPDATFIHAALAAYYLEHGVPASSLELLKESPDLPQAMRDPFYVTALFETLLTLGEFEKATTCFSHFPQPNLGYLYWRCEGQYRQQIQGDSESAIGSFRSALTTWPAAFDWSLKMRLSECLRKSGQLTEAKEIQVRVTHLTADVLTNEKMIQLRDRLRNLNNIDVVRDMRDLYLEFGLTDEAAAWEEHHKRLQRFQAPF